MAKIGIVICNYNKADMVVECIKCILESKFTDFDLYVVDNASTDNSVDAIKSQYRDKLTLIVNKENLGGTGGFNTGLRAAYQKGYEYLMCVDNDAYLDENAIGVLYDFLENHKECGMAASKVYHMEEPGIIQQYGQQVMFDQFATSVPDLDVYDDGTLPEFKYVDAVAACSLMVRRETIDKIGFMSDEFFLYWDDTDWCVRCWLAGLKVASVGTSYALHQMGAKKEAVNTFPTYYAWRNWIRFFIKYTQKQDFETMARTFLSSIFAVVSAETHKGEKNFLTAVLKAYDDAIHGVVGKAGPDRIFDIDFNIEPFKKLFSKYSRVYLEIGDFPVLAGKVSNAARQTKQDIKWEDAPGPGIKTIKLCNSIFTLNDWSMNNVYIDIDMCILDDEEQTLNVLSYNKRREKFIEEHLQEFLDNSNKIRNEIDENR